MFFQRSRAAKNISGCVPPFVCRRWRWQRGGRGGGGAGLQGEVFEQPGRRSAQAGAVCRGAADEPGRSDPRAKQRQGPLQGGKGEGPVRWCSWRGFGEALRVTLIQMQESFLFTTPTGHLSFHRIITTEIYIHAVRSIEQVSDQQM